MRMGFPISINLIKIIGHRHALRWLSEVILDPVTLVITLNHHWDHIELPYMCPQHVNSGGTHPHPPMRIIYFW